MRRTLFIAIVVVGLAVAGRAQCTASAGYQCIPNDTLNRMNKALDELAASRDLIVKLTAAQATSDAKAAATAEVIAKANQILDLDTRLITSYDKVIQLYQDTIKLYADLVDKLTAKINAPKSAWAKFLEAVKDVAYIASGILIGRAIP